MNLSQLLQLLSPYAHCFSLHLVCQGEWHIVIVRTWRQTELGTASVIAEVLNPLTWFSLSYYRHNSVMEACRMLWMVEMEWTREKIDVSTFYFCIYSGLRIGWPNLCPRWLCIFVFEYWWGNAVQRIQFLILKYSIYFNQYCCCQIILNKKRQVSCWHHLSTLAFTWEMLAFFSVLPWNKLLVSE